MKYNILTLYIENILQYQCTANYFP